VTAIRVSTADDEAALAALAKSTWSPDTSPAPPPDPDRQFFNPRTKPEDVLVADDGGTVVGYVILYQPLPVPSHSHALEINGLGVDPARKGHGIGRRLVQAAQEEAQRRGARKVSLRVLSPNVSARRLYDSLGFVVEGVLVGEFCLDGRFVDDTLMAWYLP
jgi:ribosomal protein S18 acetylase RimI-like enzyme